MKRRVTLKDIAAALEISHSTVSLALRQDPRIPEITRDRIKKTAESLGYVPDPSLSEAMGFLRMQKPASRSHTIAWINHRNEEDFWRAHDWSRIFLEGASERANELGYRLEEFWLGPYADRMSGGRLSTILKTRGIRGVLIAPLIDPDEPWNLNGPALAAVSITPFPFESRTNYVDSDDFYNMNLAIRRLSEGGCKRIGLLKHKRTHTLGYDLGVAAFLHYQDALPKTARIPHFDFEPDQPGGWEAFDLWMNRHRPDAVICCEIPFQKHLEEAGVVLPGNIQIVHIGIYTGGRPKGFFIDQQIKALSSAAVNQLTLQLQHRQYGLPKTPSATLIKGVWQAG